MDSIDKEKSGMTRLRQKWHLLYFVLAGFDFFAIGITSYLNHMHLRDYGEVVESNASTFRILDKISHLAAVIQRANAPGNDIFDSRDPVNERTRLQEAYREFEKEFLEIQHLLSQTVGNSANSGWSKELQVLYLLMGDMRRVAEKIFDLFEAQDPQAAGALMAEMDRRYGLVLTSVAKLSAQQREHQKAILEIHSQHLSASRKIELFIALLVGLAITGVTIYGSRMSKFVRLSLMDGERHKRVLDALDRVSIVSYADERGKIKDVNDNFCKLSGYSREELIGKDHNIVKSGTHPKEFFDDLWQTIASGRMWAGEIENRAKDGSHYTVRSVITPIKDGSGKTGEYMSMCFDISDQRKAERGLEIEKVKAVRNAKLASLGEMSAGIAHEINNPLAIIAGTVKALPSFMSDREQFKTRIDTIQNATHRIAKIVKSLRKFSRSDEKRLYAEHKLSAIVREALVLTESKSRRHSTAVSAEYRSDAPVLCDEIEIEQVLVNLINNAIDAVKVRPEKWVRIELFEDHSLLVLRVRDSGPGISQDVKQKLFQPFFTTKPVGQGTGLGLSIVKGILDEHQATIEVIANDPHTCFEIRFPKAAAMQGVA